MEFDREAALRVSADLTAFVNAPMKGDFEKVFKDKASQTFRVIPNGDAACYMLLKTITCMSERSNDRAMSNRLIDYLTYTNACKRPANPLSGSIEINGEQPCVRKVVGNDLTAQSWDVYYCQVYVRNTSDSVVLRAKYLKLTDLQQMEGDGFKAWPNVAEEAFVEWPPATRDIPPGEEMPVPFARIFPPELQKLEGDHRRFSGDPNIPQIRFLLKPWPRVMTSHVEPGIHRFKLTAFFENAPPAEAEFELAWLGNQRESPESIVQEIKIRKLLKSETAKITLPN